MPKVNFTRVDIPKTVGRLLPFWARGRVIQRLVSAILTPLQTAHRRFTEWALERWIECHVTFQKEPIEWYLKYKLGSRLADPAATFSVIQGVDDDRSCFSMGIWNNGLEWDNELLWSNDPDESVDPGEFVPEDDNVYVLAPALREDPGYTAQDYERDIRRVIEAYNTCLTGISIIIANNQNNEEQ